MSCTRDAHVGFVLLDVAYAARLALLDMIVTQLADELLEGVHVALENCDRAINRPILQLELAHLLCCRGLVGDDVVAEDTQPLCHFSQSL